MTKVYGLPELKPGSRVHLAVQDIDTLQIDLRLKFVAVLDETPAEINFEDSVLEAQILAADAVALNMNASDNRSHDEQSENDVIEVDSRLDVPQEVMLDTTLDNPLSDNQA
jgi:exoribonuclease-2